MATFRTVLHGLASTSATSGLEPGLSLVRTPEEWARRWELMTNNLHPGPEIPVVDWSAEVVVLLVLGHRPTTHYSVTIDQLTADERVLEVHATESKPAGAAGRMVTNPVHAVALSAGDARDEVRLVKRVVTGR